ncbi:MAG: YggT family protein [Mycobacteriales bacterium]
MAVVGVVLSYLLTAYLLLLLGRFVVEFIQSINPSFRPHGGVVVIFEIVYTTTDPPVKLLRRFIPPLRFGNVALDLSLLLLVVTVSILRVEVLAL